MNIKTNVKAGRMPQNHSQTVACGLKVKSDVKAKVRTIGFFTALICALIIPAFALAMSNPTPGPNPGKAQIDVGFYDILQNGIKVGEIYVPKHDPEATYYVEHWVLFANYVYPGKDPDLVTTIRMGQRGYESEADFFARVPWGPGFRYVRVDCTDTDRLPGR